MTDARNGKPPADLVTLAEERFGSGGTVTDATVRAIAAFAAEYVAERTKMLKRSNQDRVARGKLLSRVRDAITWIDTEDEGDRVYFADSDSADTFHDLKRMIEDWHWDDIVREGGAPDLVENCRNANKRAEAAERALPVLVKLALAEEREACAKVVEDGLGKTNTSIAAAIRARKDPGHAG